MENIMNLAMFLSFVAILILPVGDAKTLVIRCYSCKSVNDNPHNCGYHFTDNAVTPVEEVAVMNKRFCYMHSKVWLNGLKLPTVTRDIYEDETTETQVGCTVTKDADYEYTMCICDSNLCNLATKTRAVSVTIVTITAVLVWFGTSVCGC